MTTFLIDRNFSTEKVEIDPGMIREYPCGCMVFLNHDLNDIECDLRKDLRMNAYRAALDSLKDASAEALERFIQAREALFLHHKQQRPG